MMLIRPEYVAGARLPPLKVSAVADQFNVPPPLLTT